MDSMEIMDTVKISSMLKNKLRLLVVLTYFLGTCLFSYSQNERWQVYPAYSEAVQVEAAGNYLYCIMKGSGTIDSKTGNLVRYDVEDGSVKTYNCLNELSDKEIACISYNEATKRLVIIYTSGTIDLLSIDDEVTCISALKDATILGESVNSISNIGKYAYLCIDKGIIELDTELGVVHETYRTGVPVLSMQYVDERIFIARKDGLFEVDAISMMHNKNSWYKLADGVFDVMLAFSNQLYALKEYRLHYLVPIESGLKIVPTAYYFTQIVSSPNYLLCTDSGVWMALFGDDAPQSPKIIKQNYNWHDVTFISDILYVCDKEQGLVSCAFNADQSICAQVSPGALFYISSPKRDLFYHMNYVGERLLVSGGINTQTATYYPITFMLMEEEKGALKWKSFDENSPKKEYPELSHNNCVDLVQDPLDVRHFYGAVSRNGLHEYYIGDDGNVDFVNLYNYKNSPLQCIDVDTPRPWNYCTCTALQYDFNANLWMANQQTDTIVRLIRPNGKWLSLYYPEISGSENVLQYLFSSHGINFIVTYAGDKRGFFGFDTNGTLNVSDDDSHLLRNTIINQDGTIVRPNLFNCMAEDKDHQIWCGTNEGLFVITNPQEWFSSDFRFHQIKINRNDGSGFADYLLSGVDITCIAVDPSNRKWIGTSTNGVYLVSHDGQETIHHFTKEDSPLLSNNIRSIAVNPQTGCVMFGTDVGLCSYDSHVIEPEESLVEENVLVYPNPVRPNTDAVVTIEGLTEGAEVKILSSSGKVVWGNTSIGGSVRWNCTNMHGERVSSGVYHVVSNTADASHTVVARIVVLR